MSYRKLENNKYRVEVEKQVNGKRRRKSQIVYTNLKGKDLDFFIADKEKNYTKQ